MMKKLLLSIFIGICILSIDAQTDPRLTSWIYNGDNSTGLYYDVTQDGGKTGPGPGPNSRVAVSAGDTIRFEYNSKNYYAVLTETDEITDVTEISYSDDYVYVASTGVASYAIGPYIFDGNINDHAQVDHLWKIPRNPEEETGQKTSATAGNLAVFINGTPYFPPGDDMYYIDNNGTKLWKRNAGVMEAAGFDCSGGHPAGDYYHYHRIPSPDVVHGIDTMCATFPSDGLFKLDETKHSPLIGWGFDGYPIYGPFGYSDANDANSSIRLIKSSYEKRSYTNGKRTSMYNEDTGLDENLAPANHGPDVDATVDGTTYPLGAFFEDYKYVEDYGDLDRYNGRWCKTPEFPNGTYAYFATVEDDYTPAFPYVMGEELYGSYSRKPFLWSWW